MAAYCAAVSLAHANRCHFQDCKALLVLSLSHVRSAIANTGPLHLPLSLPHHAQIVCFITNDCYQPMVVITVPARAASGLSLVKRIGYII